MTWAKRYRLLHCARTSLVLWATLPLFAALIAAPAVRWLDQETGWKVFGFSEEGARAVLGVLAGSMLTFIVFVLSATLIVVQLASGQSTPRVIAIVLGTPVIKLSLGLLTFTYTYSLAALGRVEDRVPDLHVSVAVILNLACLIVFFQFVHRLSSGLRPTALIHLVAERAKGVIDDVFPLPFDEKSVESPPGAAIDAVPIQRIEYSGPSGVIMAFSLTNLLRSAAKADVCIELIPQVGDFVADGDPLFRVYGRVNVSADEIRGSVAVGPERTMEQDPRFVFRVLVDIASKALSPAINDPSTAVLALDQIQHLLLIVGQRRLDEGRVRDREGNLRLVYGTPDWPDFVMLAVSEVRQFGASSLQINRRLRAMITRLMEALPEAHRPPLEQELALLGSAVKREFEDDEDRKRASVGDNQGVGGSEI